MGLDIWLNAYDKPTTVASWNKTHQIREWFKNRSGHDCDSYLHFQIEKEDLAELVNDCKEVLKNHAKANELLPDFYNKEKYSDSYYEELKDTISQCEKILESFDWDKQELWYDESW